MQKLILIVLLSTLFLQYSTSSMLAVSCNPSISGNLTIGNSCSFDGITDASNGARSVDGVDNGSSGTSTTNTATLTVSSGVLTITSTQTIAFGSLTLSGGSIAIAAGAVLKPGFPIWMIDADADGYPSATSGYIQAAAPTNGRRRFVMTTLAASDCSDSSYSANNSCAGGHKNLVITYSGTTLTNEDLVFTMDTATPIGAAAMTSDCGDIRIKDSDNTTQLTYWIESGCNTTSTVIWVRVPSLPNGGKTLNLDYDGVTTTNGFSSWSGAFNLLNNAACPSGWSRNTSLDSKFPYGNASTYGTTGGADTHTHANLVATIGSSGTQKATGTATPNTSRASSHVHAVTIAFSTDSNVPPYLDMIYCSSSNLIVKAGLISLFDATVPSGWTRFTALDGVYPRGAAAYGGTGGSTTITHTITSTSGSSGTNNNSENGTNTGGVSTAAHTHTINTTTNTPNIEPPYITMIFGSINADGRGTANMISLVSALPPLGWTQFSALNSKFPKGASSYGTTGGASTHTHSISTTLSGGGSANSNAGGSARAGNTHTHTVTGTSDAVSNVPAYLNVIYAKRKNPTATISVQ